MISMVVGVTIIITSFVYCSIISLFYWSKKKPKNIENRIYAFLVMDTLLGLLLELGCCFTVLYEKQIPVLNELVNRCFLLCILLWTFLFTFYSLVTLFEKNPHIQAKHNRWFYIIYSLLFVFFACLICVSKLEYYHDSTYVYSYGTAVSFLYLPIMIGLVVDLISIMINQKYLKIKKILPIISLIVCLTIVAILRIFNPGLMLVSSSFAVITIIMSITIENPDMKMIKRLNLAKEAAEKANHAKSDFLSNMSHEIRTPLNAIVGFSESILEEESLENAKNDAKDIVMASQNLLEIVNGILDISKIEANKMEIVESEYCLKEHLENLAKLMIPRIGEKPIELQTKIASDIPDVLYGDIGKIKQIVMNILTNAVKYTEQGMITLEVNCVNSDTESKLVISVEDTGRGIKPDKIDSIFQKFERLEEDRNTTLEGTGLGLAITKRLVEMMGGKIIVQSKYGEGSKFTVYLKQAIRHTVLPKKEYQMMENFDMSGRRILVVDDNKINLKVATRLLMPFKVEVEECESGFDCLDKIQQGKQYDLIFMDDMMPKMTGTETFHQLQKLPQFQVPVVVLTANAIEGMKEKYLNEGFCDYLSKPIDKQELERVLRRSLSTPLSSQESIFEPLPEELYDMSKPLGDFSE